MSLSKFSPALLLLITFASVRMAAQFNPAAHADHPNAISAAQELPSGAPSQNFTAKQPPLVHFKNIAIYDSDGLYSDSVAIADLNGDGRPDLVVISACPCGGGPDGNGVIAVLLGNGDGTFHPAISYDPGVEEPFSVAIGDLNGDGKPDLVVATLCQTPDYCGSPSPGGVSVLLGNGDGTFRPAVVYSSGGYTRADIKAHVAISDLNHDGKLDLIVSSECQSADNCNYPTGPGGVSVLLGNGDGTFQPAVSYSSGGWLANSVAVADLNGDGKPDLLVSNFCLNGTDCYSASEPGAIGILQGNGDGTFQPPVSFNPGGYFTQWVAVGDVNGDGHPDLVIVNGGNLAVSLGNGDGTFQTPVDFDGPYGANSVVIGDLNGDGNLDLVVSSTDCPTCRDSVSVMPGNGDGSFQAPVNFYGGGFYTTSPSAIADLNGDGRPDVVVGNDCFTNERYGYCSTNGTAGVLVNNFSANTTAALTSSPNPSLVNQSVTFTATITSISSVPNGSPVDFYNHKTLLGTSTNRKGVATLTTSFAKATTYVIKAVYAGDAFHKSSSGTTTQVVNP